MNAFHSELSNLILDDLRYSNVVTDDDQNEFGVVFTGYQSTGMDCIAIQIVSYEDGLLKSTIESAIAQSDCPERLHFIIGYQYVDLSLLYELSHISNCKIIHIPVDRAKGVCYARNLCQRLVSDEKYVLHVDSHMRFIKHWDTAIIDFLESKNDPMGFISGYPEGVSDNDCLLPVDDVKFDKPLPMLSMSARNFVIFSTNKAMANAMYFFAKSRTFDEWNKLTFDRSPFIGACYFFGYANIDKIVKIDPNMWFYGDEFPVAARLFTHGFNNYVFSKCYILHKWSHFDAAKKVNRPSQTDSKSERRSKEVARMDALFKGQIQGKYGLGNVRTIADFQSFMGCDFNTRLLKHHSQMGLFGDDVNDSNKCPTFNSLLDSHRYVFRNSFKLCIVIFDIDGQALDCLSSIRSTVDNFADIDVRIVSCNDLKCSSDVTFSKCDKRSFSDFFWSKFDEKFVSDECHVMCVMSNMRFIRGWYPYYMDIASQISDRDVITTSVIVSDKQVLGFEHGKMPVRIRYSGKNDVFDVKNIVVDMGPVLQGNNYNGVKSHPYLTDYFLLCKSRVFYGLLKDKLISFSDFLPVFSIRLFTLGYNLFYSDKSYLYRGDYDVKHIDDVFFEANHRNVKGILGFKRMRYSIDSVYEDAVSDEFLRNLDISFVRSRISFYCNCGFDFDGSMNDGMRSL